MVLFLKVFLTEFIAEMGDKTQLMLIALTSKYKLKDIILGTAAAILVLNGMAVLAGGLVSEFIPDWLIKTIAALAFLYFAASTISGDDDEEEEEGGKSKIQFAPLAVFCMDRMLPRTFCCGYSRNAGRLPLKEQDTGWAAEYTGVCHLFNFRCIHTLPGTETDQHKRLSTAGMAGTDRCNGCFCCCMCLSFCEKREEKSKIKTAHRILMIWMRNAARIFYAAK